MDVSFIVPLFNRLDLTQPCVETLRASLPADLAHEIILVDDASNDGTREWLRTLGGPPFHVLLNDANRGYAHTNNRGAAIARGEFLALINSDLLFTPGWLAPMMRAFERRADVGIVGNLQLQASTGDLDHAGLIINLKGKPEHLNHSQGPLRLWRSYSERPAVTGACCLIRRSQFQALGGFDEGFMNGGEDVDLCYRLRQQKKRVLVANRSIVRHHVSASPGRKQRDEYNSRRLCRRWAEQLIRDGAAYWPQAYIREHWREPREFDHALLAQAVIRRLGLVRRPARCALELLRRNLLAEEARWRELLEPASAMHA